MDKFTITIVIPPERGIIICGGYSWYLPLGPAYIASAIRDKHAVRVLDLRITKLKGEKLEKFVKQDRSDIYCVGGLVTDYTFIKRLAAIVKKYNKKIIVGGGIASSVSQLLMRDRNIDFLVIGEGDITIRELIDALENKKRLSEVKGIMFRKNGQVISTPLREPCDIDSLPMPAYDIFPMERYLKNSKRARSPLPSPFINVITTRGCPYRCTFCHRPMFHAKIRRMENVIDEINYLIKKYKIRAVYFQDDLLTISRKRTFRLCDELKKLNIKWYCQVRVNLINEETLARMKDSGCVWIGAGMESVNQRMLDSMNKQITVEQIDRIYDLCKKMDIQLSGSFIFGYPGENEETVRQLMEFHKKHDLNMGFLSLATPFPGTELYKIAKRIGRITPENEEEYIKKIEGTGKFLINLTDWTDKELMDQKERIETEVKKAYYRRHPWRFFKESFLALRYIGQPIKQHGLLKTIGMAKKRLDVIFSPPNAMNKGEKDGRT